MRQVFIRCAFVVGTLVAGFTTLAQSDGLNLKLVRAMNVAVGYHDGRGDFTMTPPTPEDRDAWFAIRRGLERSGRYWVVSNRSAAELLIAIRVRGVSNGSARAMRRDGLVFQGERPMKKDVLSVYDAGYPQVASPLWTASLVGGLSGDWPPLPEGFEKDVEELAKRRR